LRAHDWFVTLARVLAAMAPPCALLTVVGVGARPRPQVPLETVPRPIAPTRSPPRRRARTVGTCRMEGSSTCG
jgi:hypothetical protein